MRIYLDARNITENPAGVGRYAMSLIPRLVEQAPDHQWVIVRHDSNRTAFVDLLNEAGLRAAIQGADVREAWTSVPIDNAKNLAFGASALSKIFNEYGAPDLYHDLFHILPAMLPRDLKVVITLHDFVWIDHAEESQSTWLAAQAIKAFASLAIPYALERADHVISISEPTDLRAQYWLNDTPSTVIMHGVDLRFFEPAPEADLLVDTMTDGGKYVVAVGNAKPYKNLATLIDALALVRARGHDNLRACLVGNCADLVEHARSAGLEVDRDVFFPGFASDEDLRRYLGHASAFVFPSLVEGFGLPPLEAMAMGTPSIVSNIEPMKTICTGGAQLVTPLPGEFADAIERVVAVDEYASKMSSQAREHAQKFSWDETAARTLRVYESV